MRWTLEGHGGLGEGRIHIESPATLAVVQATAGELQRTRTIADSSRSGDDTRYSSILPGKEWASIQGKVLRMSSRKVLGRSAARARYGRSLVPCLPRFSGYTYTVQASVRHGRTCEDNQRISTLVTGLRWRSSVQMRCRSTSKHRFQTVVNTCQTGEEVINVGNVSEKSNICTWVSGDVG